MFAQVLRGDSVFSGHVAGRFSELQHSIQLSERYNRWQAAAAWRGFKLDLPHIPTDIVLAGIVLKQVPPHKNVFRKNKFAGKYKKSTHSYTNWELTRTSELNWKTPLFPTYNYRKNKKVMH